MSQKCGPEAQVLPAGPRFLDFSLNFLHTLGPKHRPGLPLSLPGQAKPKYKVGASLSPPSNNLPSFFLESEAGGLQSVHNQLIHLPPPNTLRGLTCDLLHLWIPPSLSFSFLNIGSWSFSEAWLSWEEVGSSVIFRLAGTSI